MPKIVENRLIEAFKDLEYFSREDLLNFFLRYEPDLKEGTFGWRIYDLKQKNIIKAVQRGQYKISYKPKFQPEINREVLRLTKQTSGAFPGVRFCIWDTGWLAEFMRHQSSRRIILVDVEKDFTEDLFHELRSRLFHKIFLNPGEKEIDYYISEDSQPVVVRKLVTRAPIQKRRMQKLQVYTPHLEKILVDLFVDAKLLYYYQGQELINIYDHAFSRYTVNVTRLFSYAQRRGKEQDIKAFLVAQLYHHVKELFDD